MRDKNGDGFYISGFPRTCTYFNSGPIPDAGPEFEGVNQEFQNQLDFAVITINTKITGNNKGLVRLVNRIPVSEFRFAETHVSPKLVHDFYQELNQAMDFDYSKSFTSTKPKDLKEYLDKIAIDQFSDRLSMYSANIYKPIEVETDIAASRIKARRWIEFLDDDRNIVLNKLSITLTTRGIVQYDHNAYDERHFEREGVS